MQLRNWPASLVRVFDIEFMGAPSCGLIATVNSIRLVAAHLRRHGVIHRVMIWPDCDIIRRHTLSYLLEGMYADYRSRRR
jgi:hypothetical protein